MSAGATMAVFGCGSCGGDHREVGATQLSIPRVVSITEDGIHEHRRVLYTRGFVCPVNVGVVLVSDDSEETVTVPFRG